MRKLAAIAAAAVLFGGIATAAPASAATPKAGTKCTTTLLKTVKVGSTTLVCATNINTKTKKKMPKIWRKATTACLSDIKSITELMAGYNAAKAQVDEMEATVKAGNLTADELKTYEAKIAGWRLSLADVKTELDGAVPMYKDIANLTCSGVTG